MGTHQYLAFLLYFPDIYTLSLLEYTLKLIITDPFSPVCSGPSISLGFFCLKNAFLNYSLNVSSVLFISCFDEHQLYLYWVFVPVFSVTCFHPLYLFLYFSFINCFAPLI